MASNNGRDPRTGRFLKGNPGGCGNPHAKRMNQLRSVLLEAATPERMRKVADKLISLAEEGDIIAIRELFNRVYGKAPEHITLDDVRSYRETFLEERRELLQDPALRRALASGSPGHAGDPGDGA